MPFPVPLNIGFISSYLYLELETSPFGRYMIGLEVAVKTAVAQRESKKEIFGDVSISKITINVAKMVK